MKPPRPRRAALAAVLALLTALGIAAPASAATSFGLNIQSLVNWDVQWTSGAGPAWEPFVAAMARDGMTVARTDAAWSRVQPNGPGDTPDWTVTDRIARTLAQHGIRWLPVVDLAPAWSQEAANPRPGCAPLGPRYLPPKPEHYDEFAGFAGLLAARYGDGGAFWAANPDLAPRPITHYEIWNEPNVDAYWNNHVNPAQYRALYDQARAAIKAADADAQVLVGGVVWGGQVDCTVQTNDAQWLQALVRDGGPGWQTDGIAIHPYGPAAVNIVVNVRRMQRALAAVGRGDVPLEQTELGWALRPGDATPGSAAARDDGWFPEPTRAANFALVTDMLQAADCRLGDQYGYAVVERERLLLEPPPGVTNVFDLMEHWMGIYPATAPGAETVTSRAYAAAIARDRAAGGATRDVRVCGADPSPGRTIPIDLATTPAGTGCWDATVTYLGLPVREAQLIGSPAVLAPTGADTVFTGMDGSARFCATAVGELRVHAQIGAGAYAADFAPLVARSAETALGATELPPVLTPPVPPAGTPPQPVPACVLGQLGLPAQRLSTVARRGRLTTRVRLSTLAPTGPCQTTLTVSIPVKTTRRGKKPRVTQALLGTARATIGSTSQQTVVVRLTTAGRKRLRRERSVRATVRIGLPQAVGGSQDYAREMRLRR
ncbi:MAG: cellulase family glycosylhydrolase [Solirubrobacteraceae bacterium]|nr:cellulase family glycosylhydrolase [Solirubrobacteraceae bacterium]